MLNYLRIVSVTNNVGFLPVLPYVRLTDDSVSCETLAGRSCEKQLTITKKIIFWQKSNENTLSSLKSFKRWDLFTELGSGFII